MLNLPFASYCGFLGGVSFDTCTISSSILAKFLKAGCRNDDGIPPSAHILCDAQKTAARDFLFNASTKVFRSIWIFGRFEGVLVNRRLCLRHTDGPCL